MEARGKIKRMRALVLIVALTVVPGAWAGKSEVEIAAWALDQLLPQSEYKLVVTDAEGRDVSDRFKDGKAKLRSGRYRAEIDVEGFVHYARDFTAFEPETQVLALLELGSVADYAPNSPPTRVVGRITNSPVPMEQVWVRVVSAHEDDRSRSVDDLRPNDDGSFAVELSTWTADYWILVLGFGEEPDQQNRRPGRIMGAVWAKSSAHRDTNVEIDLGSR